MNKTKRVLALTAGIGLCCIAVSADQPNLTTQTIYCGTELVALHELRGIKTIRLEVDGFPTPVEGSDISEVTLTGQLKSQLSKAGLTVSVEYLPDAPTLHVRVLPVRGATQHFFVITAEIEEACRVPRSGGIDMPFCSIWSIYPRLGFFASEDPSVLVTQVADVGKQFLDAWSYDNAPSKK